MSPIACLTDRTNDQVSVILHTNWNGNLLKYNQTPIFIKGQENHVSLDKFEYLHIRQTDGHKIGRKICS